MSFLTNVSVVLIVAVVCLAQDIPLKRPHIYSMHIDSDISYRYATTKVTSRIKNPGEQAREAIFDVTLPNEAFITNLTIEIDGNITVGEIKEKEEAKAQYDAAKERGESAGYIGTKHRETNKFVLAISVAPMSKISFNLTYQELLKRKLGYYEQVIFIDPGQPVDDMSVTVSIRESRNITQLNVPSLRNDIGESVLEIGSFVVISQPTEKTAIVKFAPTAEEQQLQSAVGIAGRFVVQYDVERANDIGDVMMVNGYFVHFFAPEGLTPVPNDVLFILDVSGSMSGKKMKQLMEAMLSNLEQLSAHDRFNMMTFSSDVNLWRDNMANVNDEDSMEDAKLFIRRLKASGWTNIDKALTDGISFLVSQSALETDPRSPLIVFLTDGEPTKGVTDTQAILRNVRAANEGDIPVFSLAFGTGADWEFVKKLALQNNGFGRKIYEASDAAMQIMGFYNEISVTLLSNVTFNYLDVEQSNVTKTHFSNYFNGSEIVICGYLGDTRQAMLKSEVSIRSPAGDTTIVLSGEVEQIDMGIGENLTNAADYEEITEKVWAYLTIKQLLEKMDVTTSDEDKKKFKQEVLELSLKYGFVTPVTSMVVTQDNDDEQSDPVVHVDEEMDDVHVRPLSMPGRRYNHPSYSRGLSAMQGLPPPVVSGKIANSRPKPVYYGYPSHVIRQRPKRPKARPMATVDPSAADDDMNGAVGNSPKLSGKGAKIRKNKQKKQKKQKKGNKGWRFPLLVQYDAMQHGVCYSLYDKALKNGPATYTLYTNPTNEVDVTVMVSTNPSSKKKFGSIRKLIVKSPTASRTIEPSNFNAHLKLNTSSFLITNNHGSDVTVAIDDMEFIITFSEVYNELYVSMTKDSAAAYGSGILGQILSKAVKDEGALKKGRKSVQRIKIGRDTVIAKLRGHCYMVFQKSETKVYKMQQHHL